MERMEWNGTEWNGMEWNGRNEQMEWTRSERSVYRCHSSSSKRTAGCATIRSAIVTEDVLLFRLIVSAASPAAGHLRVGEGRKHRCLPIASRKVCSNNSRICGSARCASPRPVRSPSVQPSSTRPETTSVSRRIMPTSGGIVRHECACAVARCGHPKSLRWAACLDLAELGVAGARCRAARVSLK